jgi:DNA-binding XRE family transcriptional regulator
VLLAQHDSGLDARKMRGYVPTMEEGTDLAIRLKLARDRLGWTQIQVARDALVALRTITNAEAGAKLQPITVERLETWIARAERRLERRVPRL